jgi:hypothetical protein
VSLWSKQKKKASRLSFFAKDIFVSIGLATKPFFMRYVMNNQQSLISFIALAEFYGTNNQGFAEAAIKLPDNQLKEIEAFIVQPERDPERVAFNLEILRRVKEIRSRDADC